MAYESKPGTGSSYDQSLLANAPEVTRAEKQVRFLIVSLLGVAESQRRRARERFDQMIY